MNNMKHVGKLKNTGSKVIVVFRTVPGESDHALVIQTATLPDSYHNAMMSLVESEEGQRSWEFGEIMFAKFFPDGRRMLTAMQADGRLQKYPTDQVVMCPNSYTQLPLSQLNEAIAEQQGIPVGDLCTLVKGATPATVQNIKKATEAENEATRIAAESEKPSPLTDDQLASQLLAQAEKMQEQAKKLSEEAANLRKQADSLKISEPVVVNETLPSTAPNQLVAVEAKLASEPTHQPVAYEAQSETASQSTVDSPVDSLLVEETSLPQIEKKASNNRRSTARTKTTV